MFSPVRVVIDAVVEEIQSEYAQTYGRLEPEYPNILGWGSRMFLETIARTDALYHEVNHTVLVTIVGQQILKGKQLRDGGVQPLDWLHFIFSLLAHDIGYVRGICRGDTPHACMTGIGDEMLELPRGATDAFLAPHHIDRGKLFVCERFSDHPILDPDVIAANIERTRFPVPDGEEHRSTSDYAGLVRAADLIGQIADPQAHRRYPALFFELSETGAAERLGFSSPADLKDDYPNFFRKVVDPYISDARTYLSLTQEGQQWLANLNASLFEADQLNERLAEDPG